MYEYEEILIYFVLLLFSSSDSMLSIIWFDFCFDFDVDLPFIVIQTIFHSVWAVQTGPNACADAPWLGTTYNNSARTER